MRFVDFLRTTVLLSAAAATALATVTVLAAATHGEGLVLIAIGWWALAWRRQDAAVAAIEERDGACFFVRRTSPLRPIALERTPSFKAVRPEQADGAVT